MLIKREGGRRARNRVRGVGAPPGVVVDRTDQLLVERVCVGPDELAPQIHPQHPDTLGLLDEPAKPRELFNRYLSPGAHTRCLPFRHPSLSTGPRSSAPRLHPSAVEYLPRDSLFFYIRAQQFPSVGESEAQLDALIEPVALR